jgi:hypothetical protein
VFRCTGSAKTATVRRGLHAADKARPGALFSPRTTDSLDHPLSGLNAHDAIYRSLLLSLRLIGAWLRKSLST